MLVSIIIPAYNEEKTIFSILDKLDRIDLSELNIDKEIIVVDDGSSDKTFEKLKICN